LICCPNDFFSDAKQMQTFIAVYYLKSVAQISKEDKAVGNRTSKSFYE
jgi:hypothetical protein